MKRSLCTLKVSMILLYQELCNTDLLFGIILCVVLSLSFIAFTGPPVEFSDDQEK